jgi:uncharacterized protein (TIGR03086 family)
MREQDVFVLAEQALQRVVAQIREDQWEMEMPPEFKRRGRSAATLRDIVQYHAYDDAWVPDMLAGRTMDEAGRTRFDGDLLGDDPKANFSRIADIACAAASTLDDPERVVRCSFGDFPAREYLWQANYFRGVRAHDIAQVVGADGRLGDDLVEGLWEELSPHADEWRAIGVFGPAVEVPVDANLQTRLLALTGRNP